MVHGAAALLPFVAFLAATVTGEGTGLLEARGAQDAGPSLVLEARLATHADLPPAARASLVREVDDIWRREGVLVRWSNPTAEGVTSDATLRVLVVRRESTSDNTDHHQWAVGELIFDQSDNPVAVASIAAAERVLASAGRDDEPAALRHHRLGVILGRAVAHEIGHFLLNTSSHARRGLMRARINDGDFADVRSGAFFLDAMAGQWIRDAVERGAGTSRRLARFVYAP